MVGDKSELLKHIVGLMPHQPNVVNPAHLNHLFSSQNLRTSEVSMFEETAH